MKLKVFLDDGAYMPEKAHKEDAGFDLRVKEYVCIPQNSSVVIDTGVHIEIPYGYVGMLKSKSGLNTKHSLLNEGVIDCGYTGSIRVKMYNHSKEPFAFARGDKITQLVILPIPEIDLELTDLEDFEDSARGDNGFGSTGR